jgi:cytochrome c
MLVGATKIASENKSTEVAPGLALMKASDCFNCHAVKEKLVGPALLEVADRYRGQPGAEAATVQRVLKGSTGIWGQVGMLPHPQHTEDELHIMVRWIYGLQSSDAFPAMVRSVEGEVTAPGDATNGCVLNATYTDAGRAPAGPLSGKASLTLRSRRIEAESGQPDRAGGVENNSASGKRALGHIQDGATVRFPALPINGSASATVRAASGGQGGTLQLHLGSKTGPLLGEVEINPTGGWDSWVELPIPLSNVPNESADVFMVLVGPGKQGLFNVDWLQFNAK